MAEKSGARIEQPNGRIAGGDEPFEVVDPAAFTGGSGGGGDGGNSGGGDGGGNSDGPASEFIFDPRYHSDPSRKNADGSFRRRRGSGRAGGGGGNRERKPRGAKEAHYSVSALESTLFSIHLGIAAIAKAPELALTPAESNNLAKAAIEVAKHYPQVDFAPELVAWTNLIMAAAAVYAPRAVAVYNRTKAERAKNVSPNQDGQYPVPVPVAPQTAPDISGSQNSPPQNDAAHSPQPGATVAAMPQIGPNHYR